jgi:ABC-type sulfate transport system permease component
VAGRPDAQQLLDEFETVLVAIGTPRFNEVLSQTLAAAGEARAVRAGAFVSTYFDGVTTALVVGGVVGVLGAALAWVLVGRRDPLRTVFDMRDERESVPGDHGPEPVLETTDAR